ncbi:MAG: asparaginase [Hydrogenophaga sp.]|uniref:asparaginase n=1 Tax=Hydrogenophaga sp. TaxID=1904254 RepID=UPI003D9B6E32
MADAKTPLRRVILGTGGTIAGRAARAGDNVGYVAGQVSAQDLIAAVPPLAGLPLEVEQVAQIDSKDMGLAVWQRLAERVAHHLAREDVAGVVITHGTDTLEETAFFLRAVLSPTKPVVLTCAMRPSTALVPDGPQNLLDAVTVAGDPQAHGVLAVCAGSVHAAEHVTKVHTYRVDAFDSGDAGPLGLVEEGRVRWLHLPDRPGTETPFDAQRLQRLQQATALPRVHWLTSHADADGVQVLALLAYGDAHPEAMPQGLVVAGTGNGTLHQALEAALQEAVSRGVVVRRSSRCARGRVIPGVAGALADTQGLSPAKARIALALELMGM